MDEVRVKSWNELHEAVFDGTWNADLGRFRSNMVYRGLSDSAYRLHTSLMRMGGPFTRLEPHLLRNFRKYAHKSAAPGDAVWGWLGVAQHHGLPTRLLDWTYSPMVALHFATANIERYDKDGVIWAVDYVAANEHLPDQLKSIIRQEGSNAFTVEMLGRGAQTLGEFDALREEPFVVFLELPSLDDRIVNQYALFSVMSDASAMLDDWLIRQPGLCKRIVIPAGLKWEVRDKLDQSNITERVLFPGLDGLSRWLKRHYSPADTGHTTATGKRLRVVGGEARQ